MGIWDESTMNTNNNSSKLPIPVAHSAVHLEFNCIVLSSESNLVNMVMVMSLVCQVYVSCLWLCGRWFLLSVNCRPEYNMALDTDTWYPDVLQTSDYSMTIQSQNKPLLLLMIGRHNNIGQQQLTGSIRRMGFVHHQLLNNRLELQMIF